MSKQRSDSGIQAETESDSDDNLPEEHLDRNGLRESTQDNGERRKLRSIYRKLINDLRASGLDDGDDDDDDKDDRTINPDESRAAAKLKEQLDTVDGFLYPRVKHTREAALDSHVYSLIASNAKQRVQSLQSDLMQFIPDEFAEKMKSFVDLDRVEYPIGLPNQVWVDLGRSCAPVFKRTPTYHFFSGCFDPEAVLPKVIQRRQRTKDDNSGAPTIVQQIAHSEKNYEEQTTEEVENVLETLQTLYAKNQKEPLCYFQFVIDPTSFSRTVENLFHTSFLVKDGVAKVFYDSFGLPVIMPLEKKTNADSDMFALSMGISVSEWEALKTAFEIKQPAISRKSKRRTVSNL